MSNINGIGNGMPVGRVQQPQKPVARPSAASSPGKDRVELSGMDGIMSKLRSNEIRADKVAEVRAQIEAGTYETPEKLDAAIDGLLDDLTA